MPDGRVHAIATLITGSTAITIMALTNRNPLDITAAGIGFVSTLYIHPDLDLNGRFQKNKPKTWLPWLILYPYSRLLPHRHWLSHFPVISTLIRCLYFFWPVWIIAQNYDLAFDENTVFLFVSAMIISDAVHWVLDNLL